MVLLIFEVCLPLTTTLALILNLRVNLMAFHSTFFLHPVAKRLQQKTHSLFEVQEEEGLVVDNHPRNVSKQNRCD